MKGRNRVSCVSPMQWQDHCAPVDRLFICRVIYEFAPTW